jgi:hypothetical protein
MITPSTWATDEVKNDFDNPMIQSNFGQRDNFELLTKEGNQLRHYWCNNNEQSP